MAQIRNRFDIKNQIEAEEQQFALKKLPNFFSTNDEINPIVSFTGSLCFHIVFVILLCILGAVQSVIVEHLPKPETPVQNIEFKLVEKTSKAPINKKTAIRSDRNSQAGGKHNPKKPISEPGQTAPKKAKPQAPKAKAKSPSSKPAPAKNPLQKMMQQFKPQAKPSIQKPIAKQQPTKPATKQPQKQPVQQAQTPKKPTSVNAPLAKPSIKPSIKPTGVMNPTMPRTVSAPKGPFAINVPKSSAPVGNTYRPQGVSGAGSYSGTYGAAGTSRGTSGGSGLPSPKLVSSGSSRGGSGGSYGASGGGNGNRYASRGGSGGGYGTGSNPSPGNPNGTPGIDAIRQPNWGPYMRDLEQRIKRNWTPPKGDSSKRVVIIFTIGRDGRLLSKRLAKPSGSDLADRAAMSAIEATAPFRPLPPEFRGQSVPIEFTFDYNVLNSSLK